MNCDHCGRHCANASEYVQHLNDNPAHVLTIPARNAADWNWNQIGR